MTSESMASSATIGLSRARAKAWSMRVRPVTVGWYSTSG